MNLYWVTSKIGTEDWFVVAKSKINAERFFESAEGFEENDGKAKLICSISKELIEKFKLEIENYPPMELLKDLGGTIYSDLVPRIVNINGKVYKEGELTYYSSFKDLKNKTGVYIIRIQNSNTYKIGITKDLKSRISNFTTANPNTIKIEYFIETIHYKSLEKHFHRIFKNNRMSGEWFNFSHDEFQIVESNLAVLHKSNLFFVYDFKGLYKELYE